MFIFASESSIHGVNFIFGENRSKFVRVLWIFLLFASLCGFSYYFKLAYRKWSVAPDITFKITHKLSKEFPMPAVTICPSCFSRANQVDVNKLLSAAHENNFNASQAECEYYYANFNWCASTNEVLKSVPFLCEKHIPHIEELNILEVVNRSAYNAEELFNNANLDIFTRIFTHNGICFAYNMQDTNAIFSENIHDDFQCYKNQQHPEIEWNVERGYFSKNSTYPVTASKKILKFATMMNPIDANNSCFVKTLKLYIHLPNEMPSNFMELPYGSQTAIDIFPKSHRTNDNLRSYSSNIRKCYFDGERKLELFKSYTKSHCLAECRTNVMINACGCVKFFMARNKTTRVCRFSEFKCLSKAEEKLQKEDQFACGCLPPCNDIQYKIRVSDLNIEPEMFDVNRNDSIATMWMFASYVVTVEEVEKFLTYTLEKFVSDVGGLLGLFLGCSILSIVEIFFFLSASLSKLLSNEKKINSAATTEDLKKKLSRFDDNIRELSEGNKEKFRELLIRIKKFKINILRVEDLENV